MRQRYPDIKPYQTHAITVDNIHTLYVEESGEPTGIPILFIHGGPGAGCSIHDRSFFNPELYRIILFDQRGAGRSKPHAELQANTSENLVADIEVIREKLGVEKWALFGGSWGATLALLYAQTHPKRVNYMILRGIFLCRQKDLQWFYQSGANHVYPDYWQDFTNPIPAADKTNLLHAYHKVLTGDNELAKMAAAKAWSLWEARCATLRPNPQIVEKFIDPHMAVALAQIEVHYFINGGFISPNQLLENIDAIADIPGVIIHGRYDMVCTLDNAYALSKRWANSELHVIRDAGHSSSEPCITDALVRSTDEAAKILSKDPTGQAT